MNAEMLRLLHEHGLSDGAAGTLPLRELGAELGATPLGGLGETLHADLSAVVLTQVVPRLRQVLAPRISEQSAASVACRGEAALPDLEWLIQRLLRGQHDVVDARIGTARLGGATLERVFLRWLMPAAVLLADQLAQDLLGLAETSVAFSNLRALLRRHEPAFCAENGGQVSGLRALIAAPADPTRDPELPLFGLLLTSQFFRRDGWDARTERDCRSTAFDDAVVNEWFDLVEVLATSDRDLDAIAASIRLIRKGSPNRAVGVVVCGPIFQDRPEFVRMVGADRCAIDPLTSLTQANHLIALGSNRRLLS